MTPRLLLSVTLVAAVLLSACGGSGGSGTGTGTTPGAGGTGTAPSTSTAPSGAAPADPDAPRPAAKADTHVIRGWIDALRAGRIRQATSYWGLPAIAQNGGSEVFRLRTREQVAFFNLTLPCGARLVSAVQVAGYVNVAFELVERLGPNAGCGAGVGQRAYTAFRLRRGKIVEWRRIAEISDVPTRPQPAPTPEAPQATGPVV